MAIVGAYSDVLAVDMVGGLVVGAVSEHLGGICAVETAIHLCGHWISKQRGGREGAMDKKATKMKMLSSAAAFVEGGVQDTFDDACIICLEAFCDSEPSDSDLSLADVMVIGDGNLLIWW
ncbi:hypothetical protein VPH35_075063 [Triticum aestivum]